MINKVILVGNVGADPEVRSFENGGKMARIRLATTERIYNRQTQEAKDHTEWHTIVVWRSLADVVDKYVRKGTQLYIEGNLRTNAWTDKDGNKRSTIEIAANDLKLLGGRPKDAGVVASSTPVAIPSAATSAPTSVVMPEPEPIPMDDPDDLPF